LFPVDMSVDIRLIVALHLLQYLVSLCVCIIYCTIHTDVIKNSFPWFLRRYTNATSVFFTFGKTSGMLILRRDVIKTRFTNEHKTLNFSAVIYLTINTDGAESCTLMSAFFQSAMRLLQS